MSKPTGTQQDYVDLLKLIIEKSKKIDNETPWQSTEPEWWLMMSTMQRTAYQHLDALEAKS